MSIWNLLSPNNSYGSVAVPSYQTGMTSNELLGALSPRPTAETTGNPMLGNPAGAGAPMGNTWGMNGLGMNLGTAQLALGGLGALGNLWNGFQAQSLANKQFDFTKRVTDTNLNNQIKSYNTALTDRARTRGFTEGQTNEQTLDYLNRNRLTR